MPSPHDSQRGLFRILNQVFELERKLTRAADPDGALRQVRRMKEVFEEEFRLSYEDPTGQAFSETRTDVEARVAGASADNLVITETLKPIIRFSSELSSQVVQKGIVVVETAAQN